MTNSMFTPQPNYSGVTIQIANPSVYAGGNPNNSCPQRQILNDGGFYVANPYCNNVGALPGNNIQSPNNMVIPENNAKNDIMPKALSYPPQYYLNNYNYQNVPSKDIIPENNLKTKDSVEEKSEENPTDILPKEDVNSVGVYKNYAATPSKPEDMTKSANIIEDLDKRAADAEEEKKNKSQQDIVPLTDEYIKSLENYLDNPNDEIRLMASKEVLSRLDEDKDRYDDAALNALLNKMLQDPSKLIRIAALSAFASQLASGNDYTVSLLHNIQQNPNADKEDILQAADILLKMSAGKEVKDIPNPSGNEQT